MTHSPPTAGRLLAYRGTHPERLRSALGLLKTELFGEVRDEDPVDGERLPPAPQSRAGLGYYIAGEAHVQRFSGSAQQIYTGLRSLRADTVLCGIAETGPVSPFRLGRLLLAAQGDLRAPSAAAQPLFGGEQSLRIPDFVRQNIREGSPAELLLARFCSRLYDADPDFLRDPQLPVEVAIAVLAAVLPASPATSPETAPFSHAALSNGNWLLVARRGPVPLFYRSLVGLGDADPTATTYRGTWIVADPAADPARLLAASFVELPAGQALVVQPDHSTTLIPLA